MAGGKGMVLLILAWLPSPGSTTARTVRTVAGGCVGFLAGLAVSVAIVVAQARFDAHYLESTADILSWKVVPIPAGVVLGAAAGWRAPVLLAAGAAGVVVGALVGAAIGWPAGTLLSTDLEDRWAGAVMGAALGILIGAVAGVMLAAQGRRRRRLERRVPAARASILLLAAVTLPGCGAEELPPLPDVPPAPAPAAAARDDPAEAVIYLVGDPGRARFHHFPILPRLALDIEASSARAARDSAVVVVVLGDVIYPDGMHPPGTEGYWIDSARVADQIEVVQGPQARRRGAAMYFVAGNHDWGLKEDRPGARRLRNLGAFLERVHARTGATVDLLPEAGTGGPAVVDVDGVRLVLLDTAWWLLSAEEAAKRRVIDGVARALATAGDRSVVVAAHHPYRSAGPHGGLIPFWETLGVRYLLVRSGAILQDLNSRPYRDLIRSLEKVFVTHRRPLLFAGGHEHSLQVIAHDSAGTPHFSVVSGSASKLTDVGHAPGMLFRRSAPGYMRVVVRRSGAVDLYVEAAPERFVACPENDPEALEWERCMAQGMEAYDTVFSMRLRDPGGADLAAESRRP